MVKIKSAYHWLSPTLFGNYLCNGYDTVVAFCEGYLTKWVAAASVSCNKIAWVHTDMVENDWPVSSGVFASVKAESEAYKKFDEVVAVSNIVARGLTQKLGLKNITTIYNMLDSDIVSKSQEEIAYYPSRKLNLISVGRLETVKGYSVLIDAVNILANDKKLDVSLCLVGYGSQYENLKKKVEYLSLSDRVHLAGAQENPYPYVAKSDVYICSSLKEGFNIAVLEAMSLGKPVIATASAGPIEILDEGSFGILVDNNTDALVSAIEYLYGNDAELERLSYLSLSRVKDFDSTKQIKKIHKLICR